MIDQLFIQVNYNSFSIKLNTQGIIIDKIFLVLGALKMAVFMSHTLYYMYGYDSHVQ